MGGSRKAPCPADPRDPVPGWRTDWHCGAPNRTARTVQKGEGSAWFGGHFLAERASTQKDRAGAPSLNPFVTGMADGTAVVARLKVDPVPLEAFPALVATGILDGSDGRLSSDDPGDRRVRTHREFHAIRLDRAPRRGIAATAAIAHDRPETGVAPSTHTREVVVPDWSSRRSTQAGDLTAAATRAPAGAGDRLPLSVGATPLALPNSTPSSAMPSPP